MCNISRGGTPCISFDFFCCPPGAFFFFFLNIVSTTYLTGWPWVLSKVVYRKSFWKLTINCLKVCHIAFWISCSRGLFETSVQRSKTLKSHCLPNGPALSTLSAEQEPLSNGMEREWPGKREPSEERAAEHDGRLLWEFNVVTVAAMALDFDPIPRSLLCLWTQSLASCFAKPQKALKIFSHLILLSLKKPSWEVKWPSFSTSGKLRMRQFQWIVWFHTS